MRPQEQGGITALYAAQIPRRANATSFVVDLHRQSLILSGLICAKPQLCTNCWPRHGRVQMQQVSIRTQFQPWYELTPPGSGIVHDRGPPRWSSIRPSEDPSTAIVQLRTMRQKPLPHVHDMTRARDTAPAFRHRHICLKSDPYHVFSGQPMHIKLNHSRLIDPAPGLVPPNVTRDALHGSGKQPQRLVILGQLSRHLHAQVRLAILDRMCHCCWYFFSATGMSTPTFGIAPAAQPSTFLASCYNNISLCAALHVSFTDCPCSMSQG
jgi:hypothetical protein